MTWGVSALSVSFGGRPALDGVSLEVGPGEVAAVVGGDGAGKTTLLRVLAGLPIPHRGTVTVPGRERIGYVPASGGVFADLTVAENLEFAGAARRVRRPLATAAPLLERAGLAAFTGRLAGDLSGGMRRKLALVAAVLHSPDLLVLDEPTTGVDPVSRSDLWRMIAGAVAAGSAAVVSTAYLDESERAATVLVLHRGQAVVSGPPDAVRAAMPGSVTETAHPGDPGRAWRRGRRWREWHPGVVPGAVEPDLEDVVIAAALAEETGGRP